MRELFDRLVTEGEAGIDRLITEEMQESLQLEFKRKEVEQNGEFSTNDRRIFAAALSGFANSAGGLLIYGVDARKGADGVDCAKEARPIATIKRFLSEAHGEVGRLIQPRIDGVTLVTIDSKRLEGGGYLLVHVERSERRPHRSEAKGQKSYFKRVGGSFFEMEHYDIEDAFKHVSTADLEIGYRISAAALNGSGEISMAHFQIMLRNISRITAKSCYLHLHTCSIPNESPSGHPSSIAHSEGLWRCFESKPGVVIHPGMNRAMAAFILNIETGHNFTINNINGYLWSVNATYRFGCENTAAVDGQLHATWDDLMPTLNHDS